MLVLCSVTKLKIHVHDFDIRYYASIIYEIVSDRIPKNDTSP